MFNAAASNWVAPRADLRCTEPGENISVSMRNIPRFHELSRRAKHMVARTVRALPDDIRAHAVGVPLLFRLAPSTGMRDDQVAADSLGLFVGTPYAHALSADLPTPPQIFLFLGNLWRCTGDWHAFLKEVRITYLHELGHYLNFDEDDLTRRGLG